MSRIRILSTKKIDHTHVFFVAILSLLVVAILYSAFCLAKSDSGSNSSKLTELYFLNVEQITDKNHSTDQFSFSVHNLEGEAVNYSYNVTLTDSSHNAMTLANGKMRLFNEVTSNYSVPLKLDDVKSKSKLSVVLTFLTKDNKQQSQTINFWINPKGKK